MILLILEDRDGVQKCLLDPEKGLLQKSDYYRLYHAQSLDGQQDYLLRVPTSADENQHVNLEAAQLVHLHAISEQMEEIHAKKSSNPNDPIHYDWLIPKLVETFITNQTQGFRQVNLMSIVDGRIEDYVPLSKLIENYKVDARTAVWILGRFYKLQTFLGQAGGFHNFHADQVILDPRMHRMVYLCWSRSGEVCESDNNVRRAAKVILDWLENNDTPHEDDLRKLLEYISSTKDAVRWTGESAHKLLYSNIHEWWGRKYYPFTYMERDTGTWHQIPTDSKL